MLTFSLLASRYEIKQRKKQPFLHLQILRNMGCLQDYLKQINSLTTNRLSINKHKIKETRVRNALLRSSCFCPSLVRRLIPNLHRLHFLRMLLFL